ncbi:MAG: DUF4855 domain-containing protein [Candidatus Cryptobacteroides sp.]
MVKNSRPAILALLILLSSSCTEKPQDELPQDRDVPNVVDMQGNPAQSAPINQFGGQIVLKVDDKEPWQIISESDWIRVSKEKGFAPGLVTLNVEVNPFGASREGKLKFSYLYKNQDKCFTMTISQEGSTGIRKSHPRDLMLYYCGVTELRDYYPEDVFLDYLITDEEPPRRLFDGALLLEIWKDPEHTVSFMGNAYGRYCYLSEITDLFDTWMDVVLPRLDNALERSKSMSTQPFYKQEVVLMIPVLPFPDGEAQWGYIEGYDTSDWSDWNKVLDIYKWEINEMMKRFLRKDFRNLELVGLYWPVESAGVASNRMIQLSEYINSRNLEFYFIPYYSANFESSIYSVWQKYGFNYCYLQPNYFFYEKVEKQRLYDACAMARRFGMDLEMEFNPCAYLDWGYQRMTDYLDVFEEEGVWDNNNIAYYQGGYDFTVLKNSKGVADGWYNLYKRLSTHVADRWEKFYGE